ncbi:MAG: hypothetical protein M3507_00715 [Actinomycetota bacterium]|nr:hypothetical protein [Actinomycetota bacterium]
MVTSEGRPVFANPQVQYRQFSTNTAWNLVVGYALALLGGLWALWRNRRGDVQGATLVLAFLWSTIAYIVVISNALEVGENTRFQMYTELLVLILVVLWRGRRITPTSTEADRRTSGQRR